MSRTCSQTTLMAPQPPSSPSSSTQAAVQQQQQRSTAGGRVVLSCSEQPQLWGAAAGTVASPVGRASSPLLLQRSRSSASLSQLRPHAPAQLLLLPPTNTPTAAAATSSSHQLRDGPAAAAAGTVVVVSPSSPPSAEQQHQHPRQHQPVWGELTSLRRSSGSFSSAPTSPALVCSNDTTTGNSQQLQALPGMEPATVAASPRPPSTAVPLRTNVSTTGRAGGSMRRGSSLVVRSSLDGPAQLQLRSPPQQ
jgi:hypothetical protein